MSISYNNLGNYGRLGNQMFQFASLKGIANKHNYQFTIPQSGHDLFDCFKMSTLTPLNKQITSQKYAIQEQRFDFDEQLYNQCPDNVDLLGYFQSEKYFKSIRSNLLMDFAFQDYVIDNATKKINSINSKDIIGLHIRRGDYVNHPVHGDCCTLDYYRKALNLFDSSLPVIIVTDDVLWAKEQKIFSKERFYLFLDDSEQSKFYDLCIMSLCNYHIIANSSFSWWGSWLSQSIRTVAPKRWFGVQGHKCWHEVYCEDWILI